MVAAAKQYSEFVAIINGMDRQTLTCRGPRHPEQTLPNLLCTQLLCCYYCVTVDELVS